MVEDMIPMYKPLIEEEEKMAAVESLEVGWLGMGSYVAEFEKNIKAFVEAEGRHVVALSTGHAALHLGLAIAGLDVGDEVITPSFNNAADFQAILATGAQPVFCDIREEDLCIDLDKVETLISPKTKAIVVMDYGCMLCDHGRVSEISEQYGLRIIHDAAHSFGSKYKGKMVGSFSDITMFSFDPVKSITCIDGGALIVKSQEELQSLQEMRLIGMGQPAQVMYRNERAWTYDVKRIGFRYHMPNLHAAIGLEQLKKISRILHSRRVAARFYSEELKDIPEVIVPQTDFNDSVPFLYYLCVPANDRDDFRRHMLSKNIDTGIHWQPGHQFSLFKGCRKGDLSVTEKVGREIVSLPLYSCMEQDELNRVAGAVEDYFIQK